MFSKTFGYALRATIYIAKSSAKGHPHKVPLVELTKHLDIPHHFLGKIMQDLVRHGVLASLKGPNGGFYCNEETRQFTLLDILKITDDNSFFSACVLGIHRCNAENPCPMHHFYAKSRDMMLDEMQTRTVGDLADDVEQGLAFLSLEKEKA